MTIYYLRILLVFPVLDDTGRRQTGRATAGDEPLGPYVGGERAQLVEG